MREKLVYAVVVIILLLSCPGPAAADTYIKNGSIVPALAFSAQDDFKQIAPLDSSRNRLYDYANGYWLDYPSDMWVDASLSAVRVVLVNPQTRVEIYHDDFTGTINTSSDYIGYSNRFLINDIDYARQVDKTVSINGLRTHLLQWYRAPLKELNPDYNNYLSAEIVVDNNQTYTILIKSTVDPTAYMPVIESFHLLDRQGTPRINTRYLQTDHVSHLNAETQAFYQRFFSPQAGLQWGIYEYSAGQNFDFLNSLEKQLGSPFHILVWYKSLGTPLPRDLLDQAYAQDKFLELTFHTEVAGADNRSVMYNILNGQYDDYFRNYALGIKDFKHPVLFRLDNEMNGDWCSWSSWHSSKDTEIYKAVWRHVYQIFANAGVDNVLWVWNPNDHDFPGFAWNNYLNYFPGAQYVDIVGLTGYNTGTYFPGEYWRSFDEIYQPLYSNYMKVFDFPFMITEFACNSVGGDKAQWISRMFQSVRNYPNIKVANWFNGIDLDAQGNPGRIYRLDEDPRYMAAFAQGLEQTELKQGDGLSASSNNN